MSLTPGTRLGRYEILTKLGEGGMGEVYLARDPKINRDVAIKVLPSNFSSDTERLRRFEQEAQAAGALDHPNILSIHDVDTHDGSPYVVSELLEGETLREQMNGTALPTRKAVDYALQMAHGLAAAHGKGIVHRDLKPENLFVTRDGRLKILDFGIAKLVEPGNDGEPQTDLPTRRLSTEPGAVLGTAGYMSPEQVRGQRVDHRSDIFSFGCVLYEMLSGKRAFRGESAVETLNAILKEDPPDLSATGGNVNPLLQRVVSRCLEKNPEQRFQSAHDLAFALESSSGNLGAHAPSTPEAALAPVRPNRRFWLPLGGAALLIAVALAVLLVGKRPGEAQPPSYQRLTFRRGTIWSARFAPDGQTIVYGAAWDGQPIQLFLTRPESPESRPLGLPDGDILSISNSGEMAVSLGRRFVRIWESRGKLARMPLMGGAPREVLENVKDADWAPDGTQLAVVRAARGRERLEYPAGKVLYETDGFLINPRFSPGGDSIAFLERAGGNESVGIVNLAAEKKTLASGQNDETGLAWSPSGGEIWFSTTKGGSSGLYAVTPAGRQRLITRMAGEWKLHDISRDGRVLLTHDNKRGGVVGLPPGESRERDLSWLDGSVAADLSDDGVTLLFSELGAGGGASKGVFIRKTDGSPAVRIGDGYAEALSPDGKWAVANQGSAPERLILLPTGAGEARSLKNGAITDYYAVTWLPSGRQIVFGAIEPGQDVRSYIQDIEGGDPRPTMMRGAGGATFLPDGNSYVGRGAGRRGYYIFNLEGGDPRPVPGLDEGDIVIQRSDDGRSLFLIRGRDTPAKVYRLDLATGRKELWREIALPDPAGITSVNPGFPTFVLTPDGNAYVYNYLRVLSDLYLVNGLK